MRRALVLATAILLACDVVAPPVSRTTAPPGASGTAAPSASPARAVEDMTARLRANVLPEADPFELVRTVKGRSGTPERAFEPVRTEPIAEDVGSRESFWVYDFDRKKNDRTPATLRHVSPSAKWWVADGATVRDDDLQQVAQVFETRVYPQTRRAYGTEWTPGIDADPRVNVLFARISGGAAGYYSSTDEQPRWVYEFSAEREIFVMHIPGSGRLSGEALAGTLAHELCHMIQFNKRKRSIVWFNEGQAELCSRVATSQSQAAGFENLFLQQPDTQLNDWPELGDSSAPHYGASYLFLEFLRQKAGGEALINEFLARGIDTPDHMDEVLRARGQPGFEELFADFVAANALYGSDAPQKFAYSAGTRLARPAQPARQDRVAAGTTVRQTVKQYAARYLELPQASTRIRFEGATTARVIPTDPHSGRSFWWSDRADDYDARLERSVDLRRAAAPKLSFWAWYDIEADFDYFYVEASADGGKTWRTLRTAASSTTDPNGTNLGNGHSGPSGGGQEPAWVRLEADLGPYAGKEIVLRFQYVTDGALSLGGVAIDDLEIAAAGFRDDTETDNGWSAKGFIRSTNVVSQRYVVQLLRFGSQPTVERHVVENGVLELAFDAAGDRRPPILAVSGLAARTTQPAAFSVTAR
ncbi:MAG TPA: hypothetical protein VFM93_11645 [Candidatus Limnocylindria bacterium]|nr:hypothetical protein [Candidatus Limnocylindria bacterium]